MITVSTKQIEFFDTLLNEKAFPTDGPSREVLKAEFAKLDKQSGSDWIEKALTLPDKTNEGVQKVAPIF